MINYFRHFFTPHQTNNHRAKILHHQTIAIVVVLFLGLTFMLPTIHREYPSVLGVSINISAQDLLNLTNQKRKEAGLNALVLDKDLSTAATQKASYMFEKNFWAHVAPDGTTPWYFIKNSGYAYLYAGENLARGYNSATDVVNAWMASPTHRENLLSPNYKDIGFAVQSGTLTGSDTVLVVQEFGSKYLPDKPSIAGSQVPPPSIAASSVPAQETAKSNSESLQKSETSVNAAVNKPLVDSKSTSHNFALIVLGVFIMVLIIDALVIERKKIVRVVSHNLDHIIFLGVLLLAAIIIGKGVIL